MLHVNRLDGLTIAVSENKFINQIARRTILSDDAVSVLVPIPKITQAGTRSVSAHSLKHKASSCKSGIKCRIRADCRSQC